MKEDGLLEEGRLKVIQSDMKRARERNSVKDLQTIDEHLKQHKKRITRDLSTLASQDPKCVEQVKLERIMPVKDIHANFKSPSRMQLQDYEAKEVSQKPTAATYRPNFEYVLKREARPASLPMLEENAGKVKKRENFEKKGLVLCNRLAEKLDRGYEVDEQKMRHIDSVLNSRENLGFDTRGGHNHSVSLSSIVGRHNIG